MSATGEINPSGRLKVSVTLNLEASEGTSSVKNNLVYFINRKSPFLGVTLIHLYQIDFSAFFTPNPTALR